MSWVCEDSAAVPHTLLPEWTVLPSRKPQPTFSDPKFIAVVSHSCCTVFVHHFRSYQSRIPRVGRLSIHEHATLLCCLLYSQVTSAHASRCDAETAKLEWRTADGTCDTRRPGQWQW